MVSNPLSYDYGSYSNIGIMVEGCGTASGQYRFVARSAPAFDSAGLYQVCLNTWPDAFSARVDFRRGESEIASQTFELRRTSLVLSQFWSVNPLVIAEATSARTSAVTTINTNKTTLAGQVVHWEREAILLGSHAGGGQYTGCTRGYLGTFARRHGSHDEWDRELFSVFPPGSVKGRLVKLFVLPSDAEDYDDEEVLWVGTLDDIRVTKDVTVELDATSLLGRVKSQQLMVNQRRWAPVAARASSVGRPDSGYGSDEDSPSTRKCVVVSAKDSRALLVTWTGAADEGSPYKLLFDTAAPYNDGPLPEDLSGTEEYYEVITTLGRPPANAVSTDTFTLPLSSDPATLVLQLLTTIPNNNISGENGDYDLGIDNLAGDFDESLVDVTGIEAWGSLLGGATVDNLWLGLGGEPELLWDVLRRILHPLGAALTTNAEGLLTVANYKGVGGYNQDTVISQDEIISVGHEQLRDVPDTVVNVIVEYAKGPGYDPARVTAVDARKNRRLPVGERSGITIEAWYYTGRGDPSTDTLAIGLASAFRIPPPRVTIRCLRTVEVSVGSTVKVTHTALVGNGALGWVSQRAVVVGVTRRWEAPAFHEGGLGTVYKELELIDTGSAYNTQVADIGPAAEVSSWSGGLNRATCTTRRFSTANNGFFARDAEAFIVGDVVQILDQYGTVKVATATITDVTGNNITFSGTPSPAPASGDIIRLAKWGQATATARLRWAFISEDDNTIDGFTIKTYSYTG
jgi:hypothetical protein